VRRAGAHPPSGDRHDGRPCGLDPRLLVRADPAIAHAAGHGFVSGWAIAIAGDMIYFTVLMASTLWLDGIVGDAPTTVGLMLLVMLALPHLTRRWQERGARS
jgi:hypothetical protein